MQITRTATGLRMSQHGVVITELRTTPGPVHSVSDILAALVVALQPAEKIGVLGFAGGGMQAPLHALGFSGTLHTVDLDRTGWELFAKHCPSWVRGVDWHHGDAVEWLRAQTPQFDLLIEDLSVPLNGDVFKPSITWDVLPPLLRSRLRSGGAAILNLLPPPDGIWLRHIAGIAALFGRAHSIRFDDFVNRILIAGPALPPIRTLAAGVRSALRSIRSRLADRIHFRSERSA